MCLVERYLNHPCRTRGESQKVGDGARSNRFERIDYSVQRISLSLRAFRAVLAARLLAIGNALAVKDASDDVVTNTGQILHAAATHQNNRMFLEIMAFAGDVNGDFLAIAQPHAGDFAERGIRFLRRHRFDGEAHTLFKGIGFEHRAFGLAFLFHARAAAQLVNRRHVFPKNKKKPRRQKPAADFKKDPKLPIPLQEMGAIAPALHDRHGAETIMER